MARLSTTAANGVLDAIFNGTSWNPLSSGDPYISLHTGDPGTTGANEVVGGSYARQRPAFNAASAGSAKNTSAVNWTLMPTATITHIGVWTAVSNGTFIIGGALSVSSSVTAGNTFTLTAEHIIAACS